MSDWNDVTIHATIEQESRQYAITIAACLDFECETTPLIPQIKTAMAHELRRERDIMKRVAISITFHTMIWDVKGRWLSMDRHEYKDMERANSRPPKS